MHPTFRNLDSTEVSSPSHGGPGIHTCRGIFVVDGVSAHLVNFGPITFPVNNSEAVNSDWEELIRSASALQTDKVRTRIRINPWLWCFDKNALSPWILENGHPVASKPNPEYLSQLSKFIEIASDSRIQVEVVLFDGATFVPGRGGTGFFRNPFNPRFGGLLGPAPRPSFYNIANPSNFLLHQGHSEVYEDYGLQLQAIQQLWVSAFVLAVGNHSNV